MTFNTPLFTALFWGKQPGYAQSLTQSWLFSEQDTKSLILTAARILAIMHVHLLLRAVTEVDC